MARFFRLRTVLIVSVACALPLGTAFGASVISLDTITVLATKLKEKAIEALAAVSIVTTAKVETTRPSTVAELVKGLPGVWADVNVDDPANIWAIGLLFVVGLVVSGVAFTSHQRAAEVVRLR